MSNIIQITFYGQDNTSINEAYINYPENVQAPSKFITRKIKDYKSEQTMQNAQEDDTQGPNIAEELLWSFLADIDGKIGGYVVGHSEGKENHDDEKDHISGFNLKGERSFGQLVGTIRKQYTYADNNKQILNYIRDLMGIGRWTANLVVYIKLVIYSRFEYLDSKNLADTSPYFLASLLLNGKLKFDSKLKVNFDYNNIFDFYMLFLLKKYFEEALLKGYFKKYQRFERNDDRLRGSIDIARHIRLNMGMANGKIAYSFRENTTDNMVNHLILTAFDYIKDRYSDLVNNNFDSQLEQALNTLKYEIGYPKYSVRTVIAKNNILISHPYFSEYKDLQQVCLKILRDEGVSPFESEEEHLDGVLYYVPDLWEEYLSNYIRSNLQKDKRESDDKYFLMEEQKKILVMTDIFGENGHETEPDYVFSYVDVDDRENESERYFFILDAKYRYGWPDALKGNLQSKNLEDYTKCLRDMESIASISSAVAFPISQKEYDEEYESQGGLQFIHRTTQYNDYVSFYSLPLIIPETKGSFVEWTKNNDESIRRTMSLVMKILKYESQRNVLFLESMEKYKLKIQEENLMMSVIDEELNNDWWSTVDE